MRQRLVLILACLALATAGCAGAADAPSPTPSPSPPTASNSTGLYRLELRAAKSAWKVGEPISATATLSYSGTGHVNIGGAGTGVISFDYAEVGGSRKAGGVSTADCGPHDIGPSSPITTQLTKFFAYQPDSAADAWIKAVLDGNGVQLPAGTWDITARATFVEGEYCSGARYNIDTTIRVIVAQ